MTLSNDQRAHDLAVSIFSIQYQEKISQIMGSNKTIELDLELYDSLYQDIKKHLDEDNEKNNA